MSKVPVIAAMIAISPVCIASDDQPDPEFLEWLGLATELEELGVDIDRLIDDTANNTSNVAAKDREQEAAK